MSVFEYSSILLSVVMGFSITKLLLKLGVIFRRDQCFRKHWFQIFCSVSLTWSMLSLFFSFFIASGVDTIGIREFVFVPFLQTVIIFYSVEFLPIPDPETNIEDLDTFFMEGFPRFIFVNIVLFYLHQLMVDIWFTWMTTSEKLFWTMDPKLSLIMVTGGIMCALLFRRLSFKQLQLAVLIVMPIFALIVLAPTINLLLIGS